ncbi:hypothetical protein, partial [Enterobacter hormaechei]|uniref:hypothetical protein n=1 Tax=Enterobacter hormaechei TaxID=158836 RepID=UPI00203F4A25
AMLVGQGGWNVDDDAVAAGGAGGGRRPRTHQREGRGFADDLGKGLDAVGQGVHEGCRQWH